MSYESNVNRRRTASYRKRPKEKRPPVFLFALLCMLCIIVFITVRDFKPPLQTIPGHRAENVPSQISSGILPAVAEPESLYSRCVVLEDLQSGAVLLDKQGTEKAYPASLTKIMTALVALECFPDLSQTVVLTDRDFAGLFEQNASMAGFQSNQEVQIRDLLYGLILPSGADAAAALANHAAGSQEAFVEWMNQKAHTLGMESTHFVNTTGLHDPEHYTTARDMTTLLYTALQNPDFRAIFTSERRSTRETATHPGITFYSTLFQDLESPAFPDGQLLGGKTGYTEEAGLCLASLAEKNGREYILITMDAPGDHNTEPFHILDAFTIYEAILS
ncbi:D-alanyl-D-alanine carboxypeptidase family protein [Anaeromassilibacillus senegalensis]|uniref:D-alanyl-D-alanine carboxypeptidase family protein n=1 Tax=Anaeromassilibacillus senegalensis TaxID=1673717 RepID=UPI0009398765|nr:serine hydrolase [Anaeromassilibacillus senegalensis]